MAASKVYSTAAYWCAGGFAILLGLSPKVGQVIDTVPIGVLGGATTVLYGMIGILGARIWVQNRVDFTNPANLITAAVGLVIGIANFTWTIGDLTFTGIAIGAVATVVIYHVMTQIGTRTGAIGDDEAATRTDAAPKPRASTDAGSDASAETPA
jgi:NCS2 family nucleobase:cation symporter-2